MTEVQATGRAWAFTKVEMLLQGFEQRSDMIRLLFKRLLYSGYFIALRGKVDN